VATVYVTEPGTQIHKRGERLLVVRGEEIVQDIPLFKVSRLVLMGRGVSLTTPAIYALTRSNVDVLFLSSRGGFVSRLVGREHKHSRLRQQQAYRVGDQEFTLFIARAVVSGKIHNQLHLVRNLAANQRWAAGSLEQMAAMQRGVNRVTDLDRLRGHEGLAAREYFALLRRILLPPADGADWGFERRAYYPPTDPVNALLSFGYTLLLNNLIAACQTAGLDPDLGCFHAIDYGKPAMALDLEEEFRPVAVDSLVIAALNRGFFKLGDFELQPPRQSEPDNEAQPVRPVYLSEAARKRFIDLYENRLSDQFDTPQTGERTPLQRILELQAYQMGRVILGQTDAYQPFVVK
jgi:CRISPR-associated protein Cas1